MLDQHPIKYILSINLKERDKNSYLEKQSDNILIQKKNTKPKLFGHLLIQQVINNQFINLINSVRPVPSFCSSNINFSRDIIIETRQKILEKVKNTMNNMSFG